MKKNKVTTLAIAAVTSIALGAAGTFAWFFTSKQSNAVSIDTATIAINEFKVNKTTIEAERLPGEKVTINDPTSASPATVKNEGTRRAIIEIGVQAGDIKGTTGTTPSGFPGDYDGNKYKADRIKDVIHLNFEGLTANVSANPTKWKMLTDTDGNVKFYTWLNKTESTALGLIEVQLDGELGGGKAATPGGPLSPARQFEQDSKFDVQFTVRAVQATRAAVVDYLGINDNDLDPSFYE